MTDLKNRSILVEVKIKEEFNKIKTKQIYNVKVILIKHSDLNCIKGTVSCKRLMDVPDNTLLEEMRKYKIIDMYKFRRKNHIDLLCTGIIIKTFDRCALPSFIKIGWKTFEVRVFFF